MSEDINTDIEEFLGAVDLSEIDEDAILEYQYYLVGDRPLRIGYIASYMPVVAEILDSKTKDFVIDNLYMDRAATSLDIIEVDESAFVDACHRKGAKPPAKKSYNAY
ncbi:MAG: hypothetical protein ACLFP8_02355 [Alphaproteobacteria bacterium]